MGSEHGFAVRISTENWLGIEISTPRSLPVSVVERVNLALQQLWQMGMDPQHSTAQHSTALCGPAYVPSSTEMVLA